MQGARRDITKEIEAENKRRERDEQYRVLVRDVLAIFGGEIVCGWMGNPDSQSFFLGIKPCPTRFQK